MVRRDDLRIRWPFRKLWRHPLLSAMTAKLGLDGAPVAAGWGYRPSGRAAIADSRAQGSRLLLLEDSLIRSMKPGSGQVYGLVADSRGMYYDASGESDLVMTLNSPEHLGWMNPPPARLSDAEKLLEDFRASHVSKYNWYPGTDAPDSPGVMVVDQTKGDSSLEAGGVRGEDFDRMVRDALDENPNDIVYLRVHPDHRYRGKTSCFSPWVFKEPRVQLLPPDLSPARCFEFCKTIYAGTSLMGMEALIHGCEVKSYGWNFYAGWGLTEDRCEAQVQPRERKVGLLRLFEAAYLQYCHYFDPDSGEPCGLGRIIEHLRLQQEIARQNAGLRVSVGWAPWKRGLAESFFRSPGCELLHVDSLASGREAIAGRDDSRLLIWGAAPTPDTPFVCVEDGFLRSSGLGATFHRPLSWVCDDLGIYFDPRTPSRLETLLQEGNFSPVDMAAAAELLEFLREHRLTKYNLSSSEIPWCRELAKGRKIILVPGQVEADASIHCGSPELRSNGELMRKVREAEPDAYLIFKAHPDLVAGARHGNILPPGADGLADLLVTEGNVIDWLELCDEVHTMTSTVGFEAILRGVPVVTYGLPFYAGWGLSRDALHCPRRTRRLSLEELVCGAMILYPRYLNPVSGEFTTAIQVARLLARGGIVGGRRAWYLRIVSILKHGWVRCARRGGL
jgi:capsular polysaccharide export protein